jgi:hypothetical protein
MKLKVLQIKIRLFFPQVAGNSSVLTPHIAARQAHREVNLQEKMHPTRTKKS